MSKKERSVEVGKFLAFILRHQPEHVGLTLGSGGWIEVDALLDACKTRAIPLERSELEDAVRTSSKNRFELSDDGRKIRARQGHSVGVDLGLEARVPPELLYHGTHPGAVDAIRTDGLTRMERQHVHLSADRATALEVGARRGKPVLLVVRAGDMQRAGFTFYLSTNGVWLTGQVPPSFIE